MPSRYKRLRREMRAAKYRRMERRAGIALIAAIALVWVWMVS